MKVQLGTENQGDGERDPGVLAVDQFITEEQADRILDELADEAKSEDQPQSRLCLNVSHDLRSTNSLLHLLRVAGVRSHLPNRPFRQHFVSFAIPILRSDSEKLPKRPTIRPRFRPLSD